MSSRTRCSQTRQRAAAGVCCEEGLPRLLQTSHCPLSTPDERCTMLPTLSRLAPPASATRHR